MKPDFKEIPADEMALYLALTRIKGLGSRNARILLDRFGHPHRLFDARREEIAKLLSRKKNTSATAEDILGFDGFIELEREIESTRQKGIWLVAYGREGYPENLAQITDPPVVLYGRGRLLPRDALAIGVVGTRRPTPYGRKVTARLTGPVAGAGVTIISGLARGIDSLAHKAAMEAGGRTVAVVGTGLDKVYPPENRTLCQQVEGQGAVVSEYPPGEDGIGWHFRARNRVIAGLSLGVLVVEAPQKSGALITARFATDYNRTVYAVPGNITSASSVGCNRLIADGVKPVTCPGDILEDLHVEAPESLMAGEVLTLDLEEKKILEAMGEDGKVAEKIIQETGLPAHVVNGLLLQLELKGLVVRSPGNHYAPR